MSLIYKWNDQIMVTKLNKRKCEVITDDKVIDYYKDTVLSIENGKRFYGYLTREDRYINPEEFYKVIEILDLIGYVAPYFDENPDSETEGKYIEIHLNEEQEKKLNELKLKCI
ncbi:MAG: hypothetical protein IJ309_02365 [Clostridia bacterium]|nr:hypothetical protein [Clostridia bacterium]